MGVAVHHQDIDLCAALAPARERHALLDAEPMLLVDHREREIAPRHIRLEQRMRAHQYADLARREPRQQRVARAALLAAGQQRDLHPGARGKLLQGRVMLARQDLGRRHQRRLRSRLDRVEHGEERHHRLAAADIALQQPQHPQRRRHVAGDLGERLALPHGQREGQGADHFLVQRARRGERTARQALLVRAHQRDRELVGQQLVEGEALARRRQGQEIVGRLRRMRGQQRIAPRRPFLAREPGRVLPFRQRLHTQQRGVDRLLHHLEAEPGGQAIDRLDRLELLRRVRVLDMVGVGDLDLVVEMLDLAAHHPRRADRQQPLEIVALGMEEHEMEKPGLVAAAHAIGRARIARRLVRVDRHGEGGDGAGRCVGDLGREAPVDQLDRQMPQQIDDLRAGQPLIELGQARADAVEAGDLGKERAEDVRAQGLARASAASRHCPRGFSPCPPRRAGCAGSTRPRARSRRTGNRPRR